MYTERASAFSLCLSLLMVFGPFSQSHASDSSTLFALPKAAETTAVKFAPNIVSTEDHYELNAVFSPDGKEFYFCRAIDDIYRLFRMKLGADGHWTNPERIRLKMMDKWEIVDPWISPDNKKMFYISNAPATGFAEKSVNIWVMERLGDEWGVPTVLASPLNTDANELYPMPVNSGNMYFNSSRAGGFGNRDIYVLTQIDGISKAINLGEPVNSSGREGDVYVSPDESFMIVTSGKDGGYGGADMYISIRQADGSWSTPKNLGPIVNSADHDYTPSLSPDGKHFFFTRAGDVYWISAEVLGISQHKN